MDNSVRFSQIDIQAVKTVGLVTVLIVMGIRITLLTFFTIALLKFKAYIEQQQVTEEEFYS